MAYILGFVSADGNISKRKDRDNSFIFNITSKDKSHLEKIANCLGQNIKLSSKGNGQSKEKKYYYIQSCDQEICSDLIGLGIIPRKTYSLVMPEIPEEYFVDYVRGFFDGDGSVYIYSVNNTLQIKAEFVCCSKKFIDEINERLCQYLEIPRKNIHVENLEDKIKFPLYSFCFYIDDCQKLSKFIYNSNPTLFLPRKRDIFDQWMVAKRRGYKKDDYPSKIGWQLNRKNINI